MKAYVVILERITLVYGGTFYILIFYESLYSEIGKKSHWNMGVWG